MLLFPSTTPNLSRTENESTDHQEMKCDDAVSDPGKTKENLANKKTPQNQLRNTAQFIKQIVGINESL